MSQLPALTPCIILVLLGLHIIRVAFFSFNLFPPNAEACLTFAWVTGQPLRILANAVTHVSASHVMLNSLALLNVGQALENALGTVNFALLVFLNWCASQSLFLLVTMLLNDRECVVGFSGVIFGLWVFQARLFNVAQLQLFPGYFISSSFVPWVGLVFIQIALPSVSFVGHLCGALSGLFFTTRWGRVLFPSQPTFLDNILLSLSPRFRAYSPIPLPPSSTLESDQGHRLGNV